MSEVLITDHQWQHLCQIANKREFVPRADDPSFHELARAAVTEIESLRANLETVRAETWSQGEAAVLKMCQEKAAILAIARELSAKHVRGKGACTACGGRRLHGDAPA